MVSIIKIKEIAQSVRDEFVSLYGDGVDLCGKCILASDEIVRRLNDAHVDATTIEGWCIYEDDSTCTGRCYDEHTWVDCNGVYIDVTADQFNTCMYHKLDGVIVGDRPKCMVLDKPTFTWLDEQ